MLHERLSKGINLILSTASVDYDFANENIFVESSWQLKKTESTDYQVDRFYPVNQICQIIICQMLVEENASLEKNNLKQCTCA